MINCVGGGSWSGLGQRKARLLRNGEMVEVKGGLNFGRADFDEEEGKLCFLKKEERETVQRLPILECVHRFHLDSNKILE